MYYILRINKFKLVINVPSYLCAEQVVQLRCTYQSLQAE